MVFDGAFIRRLRCGVALLGWGLCMPMAVADDAVEAMRAYLDFADYSGGVVAPIQILPHDWRVFVVIDAREAGRFGESRIPGARNIEWRRILEHRDGLPQAGLILLYCDTGMLSAQAHFALRVAGHDNVRVLQGGLRAWRDAGGPIEP